MLFSGLLASVSRPLICVSSSGPVLQESLAIISHSSTLDMLSPVGVVDSGSGFTCTHGAALWITSCCRERRFVVKSIIPFAGASVGDPGCDKLVLPAFSVLITLVLCRSIWLEMPGESTSGLEEFCL